MITTSARIASLLARFYPLSARFFRTFPGHFPIVLGAWRRVLPYSGMFYGAIMVQSSSGTGSGDGPMGFVVRDELLVVRDDLPWILSREKAPLNLRRGGVCCDEHAKRLSCCDLSAHGERSAWLAAKKTLKRNPGGPARSSLLQELALRAPIPGRTAVRGLVAFARAGLGRWPACGAGPPRGRSGAESGWLSVVSCQLSIRLSAWLSSAGTLTDRFRRPS